MINSRIALSIASIGAASAIIIGGTFAFFSDSETSTGNTFTAGALDLKVDSTCHYFQNSIDVGCGQDAQHGNWTETDLVPGTHKFFNFADIKPGDRGEDTVSLHVVDNDAWGRFVVSNVANNDNGCTVPEAAVPDNTCGPTGGGELGSNMTFSIWLDQGVHPGFQCGTTPKCDADLTEGDNIRQAVTEPLLTSGNVVNQSYDIWPALQTVFGSTGAVPGITTDGQLVGGISYYFGIAWELPSGVGNIVQSDSLTGDMAFLISQYRNNPGHTF